MNQAEFYTKTLDFVNVVAKTLKIASALASEKTASDKALAEKAPAVASLLKSASLIDAHEEKRAEAQLKNPAQALDVLKNVVAHYQAQAKEAEAKIASSTLGAGEGPTKKASETGMKKNANYVGKRRGDDDAPSDADKAMLRLLPNRS